MAQKKYIHYCWFGDKPLPRLAKKCIKSWEKHFPEYEILKWSEENVDLTECIFIQEAYEHKKWAFVADYVRAKVMYDFGGIYFDTDMEVTKDISDLLENKSFLGIEDSGMIACGVWWEKEPKSFISSELIKFYKSQNKFPIDDMFSISIPRVLTKILRTKGFQNLSSQIQELDDNIYIYPREYFYPLSYNHQNNVFTENTRMIHYYNASWTPKWEQRENKIYRLLGQNNGTKFITTVQKSKRICKKTILLPFYPIKLYTTNNKNKKIKNDILFKRKEDLYKIRDTHYLSFYNPEWLGVTQATKELFEHNFPLSELTDQEEIKITAQMLIDTKIKMFVFSGFCVGWEKLVKEINILDPNIVIKILWHGNNSMHIEEYDWNMFKIIFELLEENVIKSIGFVKKTMYELYLSKGYNVEFVMNTIKLKPKSNKKTADENIKIGLYASGDRWVKNFYNQLAAASMVEKAEIDCIPLNNKTIEFAKLLNTHINGSFVPVERKELLDRLSSNDINLYVTYTECAPLIPLESLEQGVICITGNNHHYWENTELEKYLIVNETDNPILIYEKILYCLENKEKILSIYKEWKKNYDIESSENLKEFLEE